jgi:long-chain acyl-CoA synthetase
MVKIPTDPLVARFDRLVAEAPSATLVAAPGRSADRAAIDAVARTAGAALAADPPVPGEPVVLLAANGPAFLAGLVALLRAGAAPVLLDARTPPAEQARVAAALGAPRLLACGCAWPRGAEDWRLGWPLRERLGEAGELTSGAGLELTSGAVIKLTSGAVIKLTSGAVIKLTSGSTGAPRGILAPVETLLADDEALTATMGLGDRDRLVAAIPFSHSYGLSSLVVPALARGRLLAMPGDDGPFGPLEAARTAGATVFATVPAYLAGLLRLADPPPLPESLRRVMTAGAPLPAAVSAGFRERFGLPVHVFYGASECGGICYDREGGAAERGTVGAPVAGVEIELEPPAGEVDGDQDSEPGCEAGGCGRRVVVRSPAVADRYLPAGGPRLAGGRFATEDLAVRRGDGELALVGRLSDVINVRGKKVNPREVEVVLRALPAVEEVAVFGAPVGAPSAASGAGDAVVRAVIACPEGSLTREVVQAWCRERLADHKRPRSVVLVDRLPRTERGKLDRAALDRLVDRAGGGTP